MAMGGVGEAMLLGAAMGGSSAMLTGGDPLKGAFMGGLTGGIANAASPALNALTTPSVSLVEPAVANAVAPAVTDAAVSAAVNPGITSLANGLPATTAQGILTTIAPGNIVAPSAVSTAVAPAAASAVPELTSGKLAELTIQNDALARTAAQYPQAAAPPSTFMEGMAKFAKDPMASLMGNKFTAGASALAGANAGKKKKEEEEEYSGPLSRFKYNPDAYRPSGYADGGITSLGSNGYDSIYVGSPSSSSNMAHGGIADLGSYSDGGRMLRGPGDGMSDSIPASISGKRPARLADGEFVVPADVVSHLGNGSTDAGARQLYAMMNKVRKARTGRKAQGREINPRQYMAA